jgi:putative nucleotidyltransferase with HDIG domain
LFGLLSDQRRALLKSEEDLILRVEEQTVELRRLLTELESAYETTLEGWARALELRDKETEGHSRRVTNLATDIARKLGLSEEEIKQVYYGALLHDIGKMGIPDEILNKPGPLNPEERAVVDQHPVMAYDLLKDISYLGRAIEIPYSHHEHWDGTGYPQGLKGEDIPLSARIFAVVDYWDALTSDRPYRKAWTREKAKEYIQDQSGILFDPTIVDIFITFIQE